MMLVKTSKKNAKKFERFPKSLSGPVINLMADDFLFSYEWRTLRMQVIKKYGPKCQCCGATTATGAVINVDHIKPRKRYPNLALDIKNLQILCDSCNQGKGNWDETDWRQK